MRRIQKNNPLESFTHFARNNSGANWEDFHTNAQNVYQDLRCEILINEQNCLCGYTEKPINDVRDSHIDHYKKKGIFPNLTFDWNNLIAATNDDDFGARHKDNNISKKNQYNNILNPVSDNVENYFDYTTFGDIVPADNLSNGDKLKAKHTIDTFNLNHKTLTNQRKQIYTYINIYKTQLPDNKIKQLLFKYGFISCVDCLLNKV